MAADKAVQRYLADKSYPNILVHCMKDHCRNNVERIVDELHLNLVQRAV